MQPRLAGKICILALAALLLSACAGKTFNVKVNPRVDPEKIGPASTAGGLAVRAAPIWDEDTLFDIFDANLFLARVLPVRVHVENGGARPVEARRLGFEVADASGRRFKPLQPKWVMAAMESYYGITLQSKVGRELYRKDFLANALDLSKPLAPGEARQGFVFFSLPDDITGRVPITLRVTSKSDETLRVDIPLE